MQGTASVQQLPTIEQVVSQIFSNRKITRLDQRRLMSMLLAKEILSYEEQSCINQVFESLRSGVIRVVD